MANGLCHEGVSMAQAAYQLPHVTRATALSPPLRFITATSVFDGHDAAIHIIRRLLQDQGVEVVYLGHNRSADEIVAAALQEDADGIAVSSYQGGHIEFFSYLVERLRQAGAGHIRVFGGGGGTITDEEARTLESMGVTHIYSPEEGRRMGLQGVVRDVVQRTPHVTHLAPPTQIGPRDHFAIGRWLTLIETAAVGPDGWPQAAELAPAPVIGITGTGGAGKSSLMDELLARFLRAYPDLTIAVLANDPTSVKSGGALLGDRIRLNSLDDGNIGGRIYMRSLATRRANLSTSVALDDCIAFLRGVGFGLVLVETAGTGQSDTEIAALSDLSLYVMTTDYGAPSQLEKIQMLELADVVALNKAEHAGAADALREIRAHWRRRHEARAGDDELPVFATVAAHAHDAGVDRLFACLTRELVELGADSFARPALAPVASVPLAPIVPPERERYLGEIAAAGVAENANIERAATAATRVQGLYESLKTLGDAHLPAPLEPYDDDLVAAGEGPLTQLRRAYHEALAEIDDDTRQLLRNYPAQRANVEADEHAYRVRDHEVRGPNYSESVSGTRIPFVAAPDYRGWGDLARFLMKENLPGHYPYTAGVYPFRRQGEDPTRMFAGEGGPERTNRRFHYLARDQRATRLSTAFDPPTLYGEDPDQRPDVCGRVGMSGVSLATIDDMKKLFSGFDLAAENTSVSLTINGPAPAMLALFLNAAIDQQVEKYLRETGRWDTVDELLRTRMLARPVYDGELPPGHNHLGLGLLGVSGAELVSAETYAAIREDVLGNIRGTLQADLLKEEQAQNECLFPLEFGLKIMGDVQEYAMTHRMRNYYCVSVSGYHIAEAGANPITQLAFTLANGFTLLEHFRARGLSVDEVAPHLSFFFSNALDPEYAVIERVARRIWARALRRVYHASARAQLLKSHIQTSGRSLQTRDIAFNDVRTTLEALYAIADNCSSLHTNAYDEAVTTPTEESVRRALAIQQILQREFGLFASENPFQGSFAIERLTDLVEAAVYQEFERLSERGGVPGAMELRYQRARIQEESMEYERRRQDGRLAVVGVNTFVSDEPPAVPAQLTRVSDAERRARVAALQAFKLAHAADSAIALARLQDVAAKGGNVFAELMETVRCCTLGETTHALYGVGGRYRRSL
jgi:methylmalonyl-CoA mutase